MLPREKPYTLISIPHPTIPNQSLLAVQNIKDEDDQTIICGLPKERWFQRMTGGYNFGVHLTAKQATIIPLAKSVAPTSVNDEEAIASS